MIKKNILIRSYENRENFLTETFLRLLSVVESDTLALILRRLDIKTKRKSSVSFDMQIRGDNSVPDAMLAFGNELIIHIEVKRVYSTLGWKQIRNHAQYLNKMKSFSKRILWIIVPDMYEPTELRADWDKLNANKMINLKFSSWSMIWRVFNMILREVTNQKDRFLLSQFLEYLREERIVTMDKPITKKDYQEWGRVSDWVEQIEHLLKKDIKEYLKIAQKDFVPERIISDGRQIYLHFYTDARKKMHFYVGFDPGVYDDETWKDPCFYVGWALRSKYAKVIDGVPFIKKEKVLIKNKFIHYSGEGRRAFYRRYKLEDLAGFESTDKQVRKLKNFIDTSIIQFNRIGLDKIL